MVPLNQSYGPMPLVIYTPLTARIRIKFYAYPVCSERYNRLYVGCPWRDSISSGKGFWDTDQH